LSKLTIGGVQMSYKENARVISIDNNEGIDSCIDKYIKKKQIISLRHLMKKWLNTLTNY
jgi:hypothetical protein